MGGASKLLSSLLLTSSTSSRLRSSAAAFSFFFSPSSTSRRRNHHLLLSSPSPLRTLSTTTSSSSLPCNPSPAPSPPAPSPEWSRLVDRLAAAGYASRPRSPADELALASGCGLSAEAEAAVSSCLAFARDRPELLRSLPRKDVEIVVANAAPVLFKDAEGSARRLQRYLAREESNVYQSERAETVDIVRYLLSYACSASDNYSKDKELTDSAVRNILDDLISFSGLAQSSRFLESTPKLSPLSQHERFSRPPGQNIEMKRGDWICTRCSFMNFARNVRCLECNEQRPKKMLTGGEWECPQCEFYNYGRNMSCLRCDCKRPGTIPQNPASAGAGLGGVVQLLNGTSAGNSEIEGKLAENDEKAERWLSKVSQLDDSTDLSSLAADEDFPEIMPMRKGVNKFVVSTHKTPLERRLANAQYSSNHNPQANTSSDSKVSQTLDRILGRSTSTPGTTNQSATGAANGGARKNLTDLLGEIDPVPFVPLPADMFAKPQNANSNATTNKDSEMITKADNSMMNNSMASTESQDERRSSDTAEKWSKKASELNNVKGSVSAISDEFPEIMPMRKGENRFVISKKKDRSLTSPQYKRRVLEHASNSNFVPFVPFPPGYFAKKDKLTETTPAAGVVSEGSPSPETMPPPKASAESSRTSSNASQVMDNQSNNNLNNGNWNRNYSQQNLESEGGYSYGESRDHARQLPSYGVGNQSSGSLNAGAWNNNYSQGNFNESRGGSTYNGNNYSAEQPYTSGYTNSNNAWNSDSNNGWSGSYSYNKSPSSYSASSNPNQPGSSSNSRDNCNRGYTGKSLEGSAVKEPDPLDMSEEAKAERWFRRAAQIKDISELANIPDEDFPEIMPMRKGVNRFVVSKRKTPLERRLTSPQYRRNLPTINSEPDKDVSENRNG